MGANPAAIATVLGLGLGSGCFAEDSVEAVCHERGRTPATLVGDATPTAVTLTIACDVELGLTQWSLVAPPSSLGAPSSAAAMMADQARGRAFVVSGTFTPQPYVRLDAVELSATRDDGVRDALIVVDWSVAP